DALAEKLKAAVQAAWGIEPYTFLRNLLTNDPPAGAGPDAKKATIGKIDSLFVLRQGEAEPKNFCPAVLRRTQELQQKLLSEAVAVWLESIVESPGKRLRAADRGARWLQGHLNSAIKIAQDQRAQQVKRCEALRAQVLMPEQGSGVRW